MSGFRHVHQTVMVETAFLHLKANKVGKVRQLWPLESVYAFRDFATSFLLRESATHFALGRKTLRINTDKYSSPFEKSRVFAEILNQGGF
jgi:hypothetical protein